jgi:hypothetical protein
MTAPQFFAPAPCRFSRVAAQHQRLGLWLDVVRLAIFRWADVMSGRRIRNHV